MSSQPGIRFHDPPVTQFTSMDVDQSSESWTSLDALDNIYLGLDEDLDSDSGSTTGPDGLGEIPAQSHLAQAADLPLFNDPNLYLRPQDDIPDQSCLAGADDLPLFNDPDLYLGPQDDLIESDDPPAVPDSPLTVNALTPDPRPVAPAAPEDLLSSSSTTPERQSPEPPLNNQELHAMLHEFKPIGSYDDSEIQSIGDRMHAYELQHGCLPRPTVAQLLEADRPFRMAWAETCDKLRKADADLRRMQRARQATAEMLQVLDNLIASCL
ncbi:hypothetical protein CY34DRAFT_18275 [Suillus luteus UH-Slu-Lm8-n1]|uniref:Unplaced genomic scaffold CY34scaffold_780, whole genome shotgun sequence n=1 Tax=Suillus luteus UH-Slu-Lm8-n1 TaxID=930992 RepID=A0A0D0A5W3_9AGAM|nr:hypothetical protein CY34DRAFT_18275 [Suillus luteus UH-Slu-Lm8-n1]